MKYISVVENTGHVTQGMSGKYYCSFLKVKFKTENSGKIQKTIKHVENLLFLFNSLKTTYFRFKHTQISKFSITVRNCFCSTF